MSLARTFHDYRQSAGEPVAEIVRGVIAYTAKRTKVGDEDHLHNDLGLDSLDIFELTMAIEARFNIEFTEAEILHASTVGSLISLVEGKVRAA